MDIKELSRETKEDYLIIVLGKNNKEITAKIKEIIQQPVILEEVNING